MIVHEDRFIGRRKYLREIENKVIRSPGGNLSIIGQRRVGKSSLAYQAVMNRRDALLQHRILPIRLSTSIYNRPQRFFCDMASICFRQLEELGWTDKRIREAADEVKSRDVERFNFSELKSFFDETQSARIRVIFILDEFDKAVRFFESDSSFFDRLRELSYQGQTTLLTVSVNPIPAIEQQANITSTLIGIFQEQYLPMYKDSEIDEHFNRLIKIGVPLVEKDRRKIFAWCGGHPYLHDKIAFELVELCQNNEEDYLNKALKHSENLFRREFDCIIRNLRNRDLLNTTMRMLFAPSANNKQTELNEIEGYGIARRAGSAYEAFSTLFYDYLRQELPMQIEELTPTERRVIFCLSNDLQNKEIAGELNIGENTVKTHVNNIFRKLQVNKRQEAVRRARDLDLIE